MPITRRVSRSGIRAALTRVSLLAAAVLVSLVPVELLVRVVGLDRPLVFEPHPTVGWLHVPNARMHFTDEGDGLVEINSIGLRDLERLADKPDETYRIAVFGDSMTAGFQVDLEATFCQQLEQLLRRRGLPVEVINAGVNGYSPLQAYLLYQRVATVLDADLVLHAVYLDNDVSGLIREIAIGEDGVPFVLPAADRLLIDSSSAEASYVEYQREPLRTIRHWSATYRWLSWLRWNWKGARRAEETGTGGIPRRFQLYDENPPVAWQSAWVALEQVLTTFAREVRSNGSGFALVAVPPALVVLDDAWDALQATYPAMREHDWDVLGPERRLRAMADRNGLTLIPLLEPLREHAARTTLYFGNVGHLTADGHQIVAEALERALVESGLLPGAFGARTGRMASQ